MAKISIIIPSRNERFLPRTVADLFEKARGEIEVIAVLDGYWPDPILPDADNLKIIHHGVPLGMRACINHGAAIATGEYLAKTDAHCMFAEGFDVTLLKDIQENQVVIPRRKRLDAENWQIQDVGKPDIDLHYLSCPLTNPDGFSMHGAIWPERDRQRLDVPIDETMSFQGSFWIMARKHWERLGGMPDEFYGTFCQEPQQVGMKTWLSGGQVMINKNTWYAHLHKGKRYGRGYFQNKSEILEGHQASARYWMNDKWQEGIRNMQWFIEKFWPVPTWPADWQEQWSKHPYHEGEK